MKANPVENQISEFILRELPTGAKVRSLGAEDSLFQLGVLDSMAVIRTVAFCEEHFDIEIPEAELKPENFATVRALAQLVERVRAAAG